MPSPDAGAPATRAPIDAYLASYAAAGDFAGVALVAHGDDVVFEGAYGKADASSGAPNAASTRFRVASVSKTFTAAAIAMLIERGKMRLDDPLAKYLPDFPRGADITIRHLLNHQSGVGALYDADILTTCFDEDTLVARIAKTPRMFEPGKTSSYSNEGFFLLAVVVEKVSRQPFATFLDDNVFRPLKMSATLTACMPPSDATMARGHMTGVAGPLPLAREEAAMMGAGAVVSSARDLLAWSRALRAGTLFAFRSLDYPYGWGKRRYEGHDLVEQDGILPGFYAHIAVYADNDTTAIVLSNVRSGASQRLARDLHSLLFGDGHVSAPPDSRVIDAKASTLASLAGDYVSKVIPVPLRFGVEGDHVVSHWGDDPFGAVWLTVGADALFSRSEYVGVRFTRDAAGSVTGASVAWPESDPLPFDRRVK